VTAPLNIPADVTSVIPHRGAALLIEEILEVSQHEIVGRGRIPAASPFVREGRAPGFVALDLAAQLAGALEGVIASGTASAGPPQVAYLVTAKNVTLPPEGLPADEPLIARARREPSAPPLLRFSVTVELGSRTVLSGLIGVYATEPD